MFKDTFKYYKRKIPPPDLSNIINFDQTKIDLTQVTLKVPYQLSTSYHTLLKEFGLNPVDEWKIYELNSHPGLLYIVNPFTSCGQKIWIRNALAVYPTFPNKLNLFAHGHLLQHEHWWQICSTDAERRNLLYKKLRWVTLGYHHNWETKKYDEDNKSPFPNELKLLSEIVVKATCNYDLEAQAAIINYYNIGSTLSGHTDHSEQHLEAPIVSFSFGQEAVFLIGGEKIEDDCEAIIVRSGDVIVMSGESRRCYHGVPLIRQCQHEPWHSCDNAYESRQLLWQPFQDYISTSRININVRQVLSPGQTHLS